MKIPRHIMIFKNATIRQIRSYSGYKDLGAYRSCSRSRKGAKNFHYEKISCSQSKSQEYYLSKMKK